MFYGGCSEIKVVVKLFDVTVILQGDCRDIEARLQ